VFVSLRKQRGNLPRPYFPPRNSVVIQSTPQARRNPSSQHHNPKIGAIPGNQCTFVGEELPDMLILNRSPLEFDQQPSSVTVAKQQIDSPSKHNCLPRFEN
jgi:hypothetical protein